MAAGGEEAAETGAPSARSGARAGAAHPVGETPLPLSSCLAAFGTLAAGLAHEINNPLAAVLASLRFVTEELADVSGLLPEERMVAIFDALEDAEAGAERLRRFARDLEALVRDAESPAPSAEAVHATDARAVIELALGLAWSGIRHRARLARDIAEELPPVDVAQARLGQTLLALLTSAIESIEEGDADRNEVRVRAAVEPTPAGDRVIVEIADTGRPFSDEALGALRRGGAPSFDGERGLGLRVAFGLASDLGGALAVERGPGGTVARLSLPVSPGAAAASDPRPPGPSLRALRRGRILVVDDEPLMLASLRRLLAPEHDVTATASAREALRLVDGGARFDLILCDLMMPDMDGVDLHARLIVQAPELAERMLFLTGGAFSLRARRFLDAVQNRRLPKPFDGAELKRLIRDRLG